MKPEQQLTELQARIDKAIYEIRKVINHPDKPSWLRGGLCRALAALTGNPDDEIPPNSGF